MPPPSDAPSLHLHVLPNPFYLLQLNASEPLPRAVLDRLMGGGDDGDDLFFSVTRTKEEISIVSEVQPGTATATAAAAACWRCIRVAGPMDLGGSSWHCARAHVSLSLSYYALGLTGILCDLTTPLKAAGIPIFALSTW